MLFTPLALEGAYLIDPEIYKDERGLFYRFFCEKEFKQIGHHKSWVQLNHSFTARKGTVRGMHFQLPPFSEIKMIRCVAGKIWDVIVDVREQSPTFLQWIGIDLSSENRRMLYIPEGFAHGFQALADNCELIYHHSAYYTTGHEGGIRFDDPLINIQWPLSICNLSERDKNHPLLSEKFQGIKLI
jgi:dTDP-4-dehydrorhamnose 3,5-epimerase